MGLRDKTIFEIKSKDALRTYMGSTGTKETWARILLNNNDILFWYCLEADRGRPVPISRMSRENVVRELDFPFSTSRRREFNRIQ